MTDGRRTRVRVRTPKGLASAPAPEVAVAVGSPVLCGGGRGRWGCPESHVVYTLSARPSPPAAAPPYSEGEAREPCATSTKVQILAPTNPAQSRRAEVRSVAIVGKTEWISFYSQITGVPSAGHVAGGRGAITGEYHSLKGQICMF